MLLVPSTDGATRTMQVAVSGKQIDVGDALRTHVVDKLTESVGKYFSATQDAAVVFSRQAHLFVCDVQIRIGRGVVVQVDGSATEIYAAFDSACDKAGKRLRRHKSRLRDHHKQQVSEVQAAQYSVLSFDLGSDAEAEDAAAEAEAPVDPVIVAEMQTPIESLTVGEAVMRMDLGELPALMFRNRAHGGLNMVYRRPDGNVGWVDPAARGDSQPAA